mmetsp:Transcript_8353/g.20762  ORF Transcript_8353/g.20762 Transcript_8353/m.20762 type:complete len:355 (+) Transcript_8353:111-1175(+)
MSAWSGTNGPKASKAQAKPKSKEEDVESYFKINEVKKLVNVAVNAVAAERPADFRQALCTALTKPDILTTPPAKNATKEEAMKAKEYLTSHQADSLLADVLSQLAVSMPANPAAELAEYVSKAPPPKPVAAAKPKEEKSKADTPKPAPAPKAEPAPAPEEKAAPPPAAAPAKKDAPPDGVDAKKWKAAVKEGGKKGVELAGCADMGGLEFFTTQIEAAEGDLALLQCAMDAANKEIDPKDEEAKGGSGMVGKMLLSSGNSQLGLMCYVPADKKGKCNATEWMKATLAPCGGEFVEGSDEMAKGKIVADGETRFPLKDKDTCQATSVNWLKEQGLFPQADDDEGDDWIPPEDVEW